MSNKTGFYENPDFKKERQYCSFNKEEITNLIDGDQEQTKSRREFGKLIFKGCRLLYCVKLYYGIFFFIRLIALHLPSFL